jgi:predicted NAD/FAD-binding protein
MKIAKSMTLTSFAANLSALFAALDIKTVPTRLMFGLSKDQTSFEWGGSPQIFSFAQGKNLLRPRFWRLLFDIIRFNTFAPDLLLFFDGHSESDSSQELTIGEYLEHYAYSDSFRDDYLVPLLTCLPNLGQERFSLHLPALQVVENLRKNHLLSSIVKQPSWSTVEGGDRECAEAVVTACPNAIVHANSPVVTAIRGRRRIMLRLGEKELGKEELFDDVVLACHDHHLPNVDRTTPAGEHGFWDVNEKNGWDSHEDAIIWGMMLGRHLGGNVTWNIERATSEAGDPMHNWRICLMSMLIWPFQLLVIIWDRVFGPGGFKTAKSFGETKNSSIHGGVQGE